VSIGSTNRSDAEKQVCAQSLRGAKALWENSLNKLQTPVFNQSCRELKSEVLVQALADQYIREDFYNKQGFLEACGPLRDMVVARSMITEGAVRINHIARHILVVDVAGDGYCQLRALFASTRPNFLPEYPGNIFCQLNSSQLFKRSIIEGKIGSVAHPLETQAVGERIRELLQIWNDPQNPHFPVVLNALVAEMVNVYTDENDNDSKSIQNLQRQEEKASGKQKQNLEQEIFQKHRNLEAREAENTYLFEEPKNEEWLSTNKAKLEQGLEKILNSISGDLWFTFYSKVRNVPIQTFNQSQDAAKKTFIQTSVFKPARNYQDKPLACVVKVGAHWKAAILLDEFKFGMLKDFQLIDRETQVFHASDDEPNKWYLEGGHQDKEVEIEASKPIKLTSDLKNDCTLAIRGDQNASSRIKQYLYSVLGGSYVKHELVPLDDGGWVLLVSTTNAGEYTFTSDCDLEQNPVAAGGGAAIAAAPKPAAAIAAVQSAAAGGGAAIAARPPVQPAAAKPLDKLDVRDSKLVSILQKDSKHDALDAYLRRFDKYQSYLIEENKDGWVLTVFTNTGSETQFTINDPAKSASSAPSKGAAKPAGKSNDSCVVM
jgi:hypothetical protein